MTCANAPIHTLKRNSTRFGYLATVNLKPSTARQAALYLRVSLDRTGEQLAVSRQREDCAALCVARGWEVVGEYVDNSISASDARKQRPGYDALVTAYEAGEFDALVCWDLDRLTRQPRQLEDWIDRADARGLVIVTANGEADLSTDAGMMFARIRSAVARGEVDRKGARQRRALQQRADMGRPPLGVRLTGYTTTGEIEPGEAATIRRIFTSFNQGQSLRGIVAELRRDGVPTRRGGQWSPSSVSGILANPRYAGRAVYQGKETGKHGTWEPIVSEETYACAQVKLSDPRRKTNQGDTDRKHLGSGLYVCGRCGGQMSGWSGVRYRCKAACFARSRGPVDQYVEDVIRERLSRDDARQLAHYDDQAETAPLREEVERLRGRLAQIDNDYDEGTIDGRRHATATEKVRAQLVTVERRLTRLSSSLDLSELVNGPDPAGAYVRLDLMPRRAVLDALMVVTLYPGTHGSRTFDPSTVQIAWKGSTE